MSYNLQLSFIFLFFFFNLPINGSLAKRLNHGGYTRGVCLWVGVIDRARRSAGDAPCYEEGQDCGCPGPRVWAARE